MNRKIPITNTIDTFFHCRGCMDLKPAGMAPREWARLEVGFTRWGLQVWCCRCDKNICHIDMEGARHPASFNAFVKPPYSRSEAKT